MTRPSAQLTALHQAPRPPSRLSREGGKPVSQALSEHILWSANRFVTIAHIRTRLHRRRAAYARIGTTLPTGPM